MKKITKRILALVVAMTMLLAAVPVYAAMPAPSPSEIVVEIPKTETATLYPNSSWKFKTYYLGYISYAKKVTVKSSNTSVATISTPHKAPGYAEFTLTLKKEGTTNLTIVADKKTYKCKLTVKKYTNPISSIKIGSKTISGSKWNKMDLYNLKYNDFKLKKSKITVKLKSGWKLDNGGYMDYFQKGWMKSERMKNGKTITIKGGAGFQIWVWAVNTKTKQRVMIRLNFK